MKRKILILIFLSFVFAGNLIENYYPEEVGAFTWSTPKPTASPRPIWNTPRPTASPKPTASPEPTTKPTPTPTGRPTATTEITQTPDPFASPSPTPSPTPERPQLPAIAIPGLEYPATEAPKATLNPDEFQDDITPAPVTPTPSPEVTKAPEKNRPTWSGLIKFITTVFYSSAVITAIYALFFFIICTLFGKKPSSGFDILKKKKKKKKMKKKVVASPDTTESANKNIAPVKFQRHDDASYHPVIDAGEDTETASDFSIENVPEENTDLSDTAQIITPEPVANEAENITSEKEPDLLNTAEFDVFTEEDLPAEEPVLEAVSDETEVSIKENEQEDSPEPIFEEPKASKPLIFRRAIDRPDDE